jgi:TrmH family RNA methyltransferase
MTRNARFQEWEALLGNRNKRQRKGEFLVQGVRPITMAVRYGWEIRELLCNADVRLSAWARGILDSARATEIRATQFDVAGELMAELGGKTGDVPELLAVAGIPADDLGRIPAGPGTLIVVFDRPATPGNIGTLIRSADAFGAGGVIVTGHAADLYDPKCVRASTGSLFAVPAARVPAHRQVLEWVSAIRQTGVAIQIVGTDEKGDLDAAGYDFTQPTLLVIGNETTGLSVAWREACDHLLRIPMAAGAASSLNAATAASVVLYESIRQKRPLPDGHDARPLNVRHPVLVGAPDQADEFCCLYRAPEAGADIGDLDTLVSDLSVADDRDEVVTAPVA